MGTDVLGDNRHQRTNHLTLRIARDERHVRRRSTMFDDVRYADSAASVRAMRSRMAVRASGGLVIQACRPKPSTQPVTHS
jgi:hypothetical protein